MSEHEATVTQTAAPVEDHATTPAGDVLAGLSAIGAAGNAAVARQIHSSGCHLTGLSLAGNAAVRRALGQPGLGGGAAPSGFTDRLGKAEAGQPIPDEPRQSLETSFGTSLADVRLHVGSQSGELAAEVSANAFTVNKDIYFGDGQFAPGSQQGYHLLAHEVTHTLQQGGAVSASSATVSDPADASEREAEDVATRVTQQRAAGPVQGTAPDVTRDATDLIPDFILDGVKSAISAIPGYDLLAGIIGKDPITDQPVRMNRTELIEKLLTYGPFGANVGQVLQAVDVLGDVYTLVTDGLAANNLTMARIERDIGAAWDEISVTDGIDGNAAIVRRYVDAILNDVSGFVRGIVDQVIEKVRAVVAEVAEPHLQDPQIKPVWDLARKVLHYDPLRGEDVNAPTVEILGDFLRLIGKQDALAQMTERGTLQQTADWLDTQFATFASIKNDLLQLFADAWDAISPQNLPNLLDTLPRLAQRAFDLVRRIGAFAATVLAKVLELVKVSLLGWLSQHAHEMPGFRLMTVMLGQNPFTGDTVPRTAANLIAGFITLLPNGEATYQQLAESGVIDEAAGRIESAMTRLNITTELITGTFLGIWNSLSLEDLLAPIPAFERILARFSDPLNRIIEFATEVVKVVIELILKLMNFPSDLIGSIISNAMTAIEDIKRDPVAFLLNMLQALKSGFMGFFDNILPYLLDGLTSWLFRGLGQIGITRPADLSLESVLGLALQVLGITADSLWQKVGEHIGPERMQQMRNGVDRLSGAWQFIKDVQEGGAAAIWRYVTDQLSNLWDTVIEMAKNWIMSEIVEKVTTKLISMLDPTGVMAVINSMVAFFNAIQSAIEYLRDILTIVNDYVTTFAQVAAGNIVPGAQKITEGLGHAVPIAIGFLANQVGLGNIPEKIVEIIGGLREMVDQAIDWLIQQAVSLGQSAMNALGLGGEQPETPAETPAAPVDPLSEDQQWVYEHPEGGHTIRIAPDLSVYQFSTPTLLTGPQALAQQQAALRGLVPVTAVVYPLDSLGRAQGPSGHIEEIKDGEERDAMPPAASLPGGLAAYEPGDARGHLIGDRFNGAATAGNLVPMHSTLNLSTFKSYENQIASAFKKEKEAGRPAIIHMSITPQYPDADPAAPGRHFRPERIVANSTLFTLATNGTALSAKQQQFPGDLVNPSNAITIINLNTASKTEILAAYSGTIDRNVHELVDAIIAIRPQPDLPYFYGELANRLGADKAAVFDTLLTSRAARFILA
jgi:hypothetical protein